MSNLPPSGVTITPSSFTTQITPTRIITSPDQTDSLVRAFLIPFISGLSVPVPTGTEPVAFAFRYLPNGNGLSVLNFAPVPSGS